MPDWPDTLPQEFEAQGYQDQLPEQLVRSDLDGEEKERRQARRGQNYPIAGRMQVTTSQYLTLLAFFQNDLGTGALAFDFPDPDGTLVNPDDPDSAVATIRVAFTSPPELSTIGGDYHVVSLALERQY